MSRLGGETSVSDCNQRRDYLRDGFLALPGLFHPAEAARWAVECARLLASPRLFGGDRPVGEFRGHLERGRVVDRLDPVTVHSPIFRDLAADALIRRVATRLLDDDAVLFKDKLIVKAPGTVGYGLHQDYPYWESPPAPPDAFVTIMLAVDAAGLGSGSLELFPGQHHAVLRAPANAPLDAAEDAVDVASGVRTTMRPGDGLAFHGLAPHRSAPNRSAAYRRALFFTYNAARYGPLYADFYAKRDRRGADSAQP